MMKYSVYGCKVNKFYLNKWLQYFRQRGFDGDNAHLLASCVVTDRAKSKRIKGAKSILEDGEHLYLTGCGAFEKGEAMDYEKFFALYPELLNYKDQLTLLGEDPSTQSDLGAIGEYELNQEIDADALTPGNVFTKKFVVIQSGCDTFCTFCLTIYRRGSHRSRTIGEIVEEIQTFVDQGGEEIVITGVNLAAWGASHTRKPQENRFSELLEQILLQTTIQRIRISSLGPEFLDERFYELMCDERFLPHFHVSVQSFATPVLQRMNRNYTAETLDSVMRGLRGLQRSDQEYISIGADIIVGFPGESEEDFQQTLQAISDYRITKLHAFPFSPHQKGEAVPAGKLSDQVPTGIKKQRMQQILALGDEVRENFIKLNEGVEWPVLLESQKNGLRTGRTPNYISRETAGNYQRGQLVLI